MISEISKNLYEPEKQADPHSHENIRKRKTSCEVCKINLRDINEHFNKKNENKKR